MSPLRYHELLDAPPAISFSAEDVKRLAGFRPRMSVLGAAVHAALMFWGTW